MNLMKQGWAGLLAQPCGTNGLATCVGLAVWSLQHQQWLIGHFDCKAQVRRSSGDCFNAVVLRTQALATQMLQAPGPAFIVSPDSDLSSRAMIAGLRLVYPEAEWFGYSGFFIDNAGLHSLDVGENTTPGTWPVTVPAFDGPDEPCRVA